MPIRLRSNGGKNPLAEWHRAVPAEFEEEKVTELEQKINSVKRHLAQQKSPAAENPALSR